MECMPRLEPFIEYFKTKNASPCTIVASRLYSAYLEWCETTEEEPLSIRSFGLELKQLSGVVKGHSMSGNIYTIV
jgi:phage/plasmid-associated DNA primase